MKNKRILIGIIVATGILALVGLIIWQRGLLRNFGPGTACPAIAPGCDEGQVSCQLAAESLERSYPGCGFKEYCNFCDSAAPQLEIGPDKLICVQVYNPVCGTDNKTYSNGCFAELAKVGIQHDGECQ